MNNKIKDKLDFYNIREEVIEFAKTLEKPIQSELEYKYTWICRNLLQYKNCFVNDKTLLKLDLDVIKEILGVKKINVEAEEFTESNMSYGSHGFILSI